MCNTSCRALRATANCPRASSRRASTSTEPATSWCRSEERRVGKECRSLCDWSSDVCSSDLVNVQHLLPGLARHRELPARLLKTSQHFHGARHLLVQIGRASCRERV